MAAQTGSSIVLSGGEEVHEYIDFYDLYNERKTVSNISKIAGVFNSPGNLLSPLQLNAPISIAFDSQNSMYIADLNNHRILKSFVNGTYILYAGATGACAYADGNLQTARFCNPRDLMIVGSIMYVVDHSNHVVRKISLTTSTVTTIAGKGGVAGYSGDNGNATLATLNRPTDIISDPFGNLYVSEALNHVIRKINSTGFISTIAGVGVSGFSGDSLQIATSCSLNEPDGLEYKDGYLYIAEAGNHRIRKLDLQKGIIWTIVGGHSNFNLHNVNGVLHSLNRPRGLLFDNSKSNLFIANTDNHNLLMMDSHSRISVVAGWEGIGGIKGDQGPAVFSQLFHPFKLAINSQGDLYIPQMSCDIKNSESRSIFLSLPRKDANSCVKSSNMFYNIKYYHCWRKPEEWKPYGPDTNI